jgi:ParB family transcriptional regulator, chromosome partitioning protein
MTTSNAAVDKTVDKTGDKAGAAKISEKLSEKRRALGRGLDSLLPGPRVVAVAPTLPQSARKDGAPAPTPASSQFSVSGSQDGGASSALAPSALPPTSSASSPSSSSVEFSHGRPGAAVATQIDSLQAVASGDASEGQHAFEIALDRIDANPYQTRSEFDLKALSDLAGSIQAQGVLQPIVVRPRPILPGSHGLGPRGGKVGLAVTPPERTVPEGEQRYVLILGERRFRASKMAGKTTIPAIVKRVSEQQAAEMTLVENLQRQDLECLDQAEAFSKLSTVFNLTQEEIGNRVGVSREQVSNYLRLLKLPPEVQVALRKKELTYSHARLLVSLDDEIQIMKVARVAIARKMSVALLQELVMDSHIPKDPAEARKASGARWVDPNVRAEQRSLEAILGLRVRIRDRKGKGKILIEYGTIEEFDRVVMMLKGK